MGVPPNHPFIDRFFHYQPSIWGYPHLWKPPFIGVINISHGGFQFMICSDNHRTSEFSSMFDEIGGYHLSSFGSRLQLGNSSRINRIRSFSCEQQVEKVTVDSLGYKLYLHVCTYIYIFIRIQFNSILFNSIHVRIHSHSHLHYIYITYRIALHHIFTIQESSFIPFG